jgi:hypothetical protein
MALDLLTTTAFEKDVRRIRKRPLPDGHGSVSAEGRRRRDRPEAYPTTCFTFLANL